MSDIKSELARRLFLKDRLVKMETPGSIHYWNVDGPIPQSEIKMLNDWWWSDSKLRHHWYQVACEAFDILAGRA